MIDDTLNDADKRYLKEFIPKRKNYRPPVSKATDTLANSYIVQPTTGPKLAIATTSNETNRYPNYSTMDAAMLVALHRE
jgi:hypothetical protein